MWAPNPAIDDEILDKYITEAKDKFGYNVEQVFIYQFNIYIQMGDKIIRTPMKKAWPISKTHNAHVS
ncbi:hypothetical protein TNCV_4453291 [Trichonephila clavipes]|nr:hypothetical protein TNCV_4453291 [Trichonephila clavipes]